MQIYRGTGLFHGGKQSKAEVLEKMGIKRVLKTEIKIRQVEYFGHITITN